MKAFGLNDDYHDCINIFESEPNFDERRVMRLAVISDIHGNFEAMKCVYAVSKKGSLLALIPRPFPNDFFISDNFYFK